MNVKKYRRKPVIIEAIQFIPRTPGNDLDAIEKFVEQYIGVGDRITWAGLFGIQIWNDIEECWYLLSEGDWLVKGEQGQFYSCKPETFELECGEVK